MRSNLLVYNTGIADHLNGTGDTPLDRSGVSFYEERLDHQYALKQRTIQKHKSAINLRATQEIISKHKLHEQFKIKLETIKRAKANVIESTQRQQTNRTTTPQRQIMVSFI
jgi:hypothetical protein